MCVLKNLTVKNFRKSDNKDFSNHHYMVDVYLGDKLITQYHYNPFLIIFNTNKKFCLTKPIEQGNKHYGVNPIEAKLYLALETLNYLRNKYQREIFVENIINFINPYKTSDIWEKIRIKCEDILDSNFEMNVDYALDKIMKYLDLKYKKWGKERILNYSKDKIRKAIIYVFHNYEGLEVAINSSRASRKPLDDYNYCNLLCWVDDALFSGAVDIIELQKKSREVERKYKEESQRDLRDAIEHIMTSDKKLDEILMPDLKDVEYSLVSDAECAESSLDFDDFCANLGYSNDSRKAEKIYNACKDMLALLMNTGKYEEMKEVYQDY